MAPRTMVFPALVLCALLIAPDVGAQPAPRGVGQIEDDIQKIRDGLARGGPAAAATPPAANDLSGCIGSNPSGRLSLLGVVSDVGPSTKGMSPVMKLGPAHPAMKALGEMATRMGLTAQSTEEARQLKAFHDTYAFYVGARERGAALEGTPIVDLFAWVHEGKMEQMARAYVQYEAMARQYAALHQAAEAAGQACP